MKTKIRQLVGQILLASSFIFQQALADSECIGFYIGHTKKMIVYTGKGDSNSPSSGSLLRENTYFKLFKMQEQEQEKDLKINNTIIKISTTFRPHDLFFRIFSKPNTNIPHRTVSYIIQANGDFLPFMLNSNNKNGHLDALHFNADTQPKANLDFTNVTVVGDGIQARLLQELNEKGISATSIDIDYSQEVIRSIQVSPLLKQRLKKGDVRKLSLIRSQQKFILAKDLLDSLVNNEDRVKALNEISKALAVGGEARLTFSGKDTEYLVRSLNLMSYTAASQNGINFSIERSQVEEGSMVLVIRKTRLSSDSSNLKPGEPFATIRESSAEFLLAVKRTIGEGPKEKDQLTNEQREMYLFSLFKITFFKDMKINPDSNFDRALLNFFRDKLMPLIQAGNYKGLLEKLSPFELVGQRINYNIHGNNYSKIDLRQSPEARFEYIKKYLGCPGCNVEFFIAPLKNEFIPRNTLLGDQTEPTNIREYLIPKI